MEWGIGIVPVRRALLRVAILALCVSALIAIVAVVRARFGDTEARVLLTHAAVAIYSLLALAIAAAAQRRRGAAVAGWIACGAGLALAVASIWAGWDGEHDDLYRAAWILLVTAFTAAHASLLDSRRREADGAAVRVISDLTTLAVVLLGVLVVLATAADYGRDWYVRLIGVVGVLDALGTLVLPIARKLQR